MATNGESTSLSSMMGLGNKASSIQTRVGVNTASPLSAKQQQHMLVMKQQANYPKGRMFSVTIQYAHQSGNAQGDLLGYFRLFDALGMALASGVNDTAAGITYTSTFAGGTNNAQTAYTIVKEYTKGSRMGSIGTVFTYGSSSYIGTTNLQFWNGNIQQYMPQQFTDYTTLAQDTYANNQAQLILNTAIWLNPFFALTGVLPDPGSGNPPTSLSILFNVCSHGNF